MLICPFVAFLLAEALSLSGYTLLITMVFLLKLYAKPNVQSDKVEFLKVCLVSISHLFKQIAFILMGLSLPLHVG
jgi:NhaP-type Na+/H+ or K+/H+ antiporter